uniref:Phosphoinositide 3-kinase regulatory subunit 5 n=1 Tax=Anabas testudineus TaxID=64144 RepID=A0A7N6F9U2_ANATE
CTHTHTETTEQKVIKHQQQQQLGSMNRWSLEELVKRDPENFLILLQQIVIKTKEVLEQCQYELVVPLAIMFSSTLLQTPYCPADTELLEEAVEVFRCFLTWPEPYCSVCRNLLSTLQLEIKAPGISFQRLVREEQGLNSTSQFSRTMTVLLMNPGEVPPEFLSVAEQLSHIQHSQKETYITLIKHAFQSTLGTKYPLHSIHRALGAVNVNIKPTSLCYVSVLIPSDVLNTLLEHDPDDPITNGQAEDEDEVDSDDDDEDDEDVTEIEVGGELKEDKEEEGDGVYLPPMSISSINHRASTFSTISSLSTASKDSMFSTLSVASECYAPSLFSVTSGVDSDYFEDSDDYISSSPIAEKCSPKSTKASARLSQHLYRIFMKPKSPRSLSRAKSLGNTESKDILIVREKRSNSLPQQVKLRSPEPLPQPQSHTLRHVCFRRRPILSSDEDSKNTTLRVVVFGADHVAGKVARAYNSLRRNESASPRLSRAFKLQFYFVPVKRDSTREPKSRRSSSPVIQIGTSKGAAQSNDVGDSTNDIAHLLGMLDPWYERNTLSLLKLPANVVCQQTSKTESESYDNSYEQRLPILADLVLYYCRFAARPALIQLYQIELTLACGERKTEVFVHSLELGHTAGTRAIKAMGAASKRFGIDGDREAVPLSLEVMYNRVVISGRSQWKREAKVCTSVNLTKACKNPEELDSKMECLQLTMTEVLKRQNGKSKKGFNQVSVTEVKVDKVQVSGAGNTTFAVCLDQDEKKILQSVTRCEISVCYKPDSSTDWRLRKFQASAQIQPLHPTFCSLLCLPIVTFSGALP